MGISVDRRTAIGGAISFAAGAVAATGTAKMAQAIDERGPLPFYTGPAASVHADRRTAPKHPHVNVVWSVDTTQRLIALTFDDGPKPEWTPKVLDSLRRHRAPGTFFVVGKNLVEHGALLAGHIDQHEFGNHTWEHRDLARQDLAAATDALARTHEAIQRVLGRAPTLMRPPYGHIAGSSMLASAELGYTVVLWSRQMSESDYLDNPPGLVDYIVSSGRAGDIVLAHDTGPQDRLITIENLDAMIQGLRKRGFDFVTVSQLLGTSPA